MTATDTTGKIYANYAATTPSLTPRVAEELAVYLSSGMNLNAGRNFEGLEDCVISMRARRAVATLFGVSDPLKIIFTSGATEALNIALRGLLRRGDHVLMSGLEHNAVARPLHMMKKNGLIEIDILPCAQDGTMDFSCVARLVKKNTRLLVMTHASNVLGMILPVAACFASAKEFGVITVLDAAQTAGVLPLRMDGNTDVIAFPGHKGLRGLAGVGGLALSEAAAREIVPILAGGTGSASHSLDMPDFLPDMLEPGTRNTIGILSLAASVEEICDTGVDVIRQREVRLTSRFLEGLRGIPELTIQGTRDANLSVAVVSVSAPGADPGVIARRLFDEFGIITRSGLHCSPLAHKTAGTYGQGTVRISFGSRSTDDEADAVVSALSGVISS